MLLIVAMIVVFFAFGLSVREFDRGVQQWLIAAITVIVILVFFQGIF